VIQNMTHLLRVEDGEASISKYKKEIKMPVEPQLLEIILQWLKQRVSSGPERQA